MRLRVTGTALVLAAAAALAGLLGAPETVAAGDGGAPTAISIGVPEQASLGQKIYLQAVLIDGTGTPLPEAQVVFTSAAEFLNAESDVTLTSAQTNEQGVARTRYEVRRAGQLTIRAEFRGDKRYAPAQAQAELTVTGSSQLYVQTAGVQIPGLNSAPESGPLAALRGQWPGLSAWPIVAVVLVVWSLYAWVAVLLLFIGRDGEAAAASAGGNRTTPPSAASEGNGAT